MQSDPYLESLIRRVDEDGPVLALDEGIVGIFDPALALEVDCANSKGLMLPGSLSSLGRKPDDAHDVTWREARALLIQRSRQLSSPAHLEALHERMRGLLTAQSGRTADLTALTVELFSKSLLPLVVDGLPRHVAERLEADQQLNFNRLSGTAGGRLGWVGRLTHLFREAAAGRAISRELERRIEGSAPPRDDYAQAILPLVPRIGVARARYLLTTLLTAVGSPPGMVAACVLFELLRNPDWHDRIASELTKLQGGEIYAGARTAPLTARFIKETMRLWPFPLVTHRIAYRELEVAGNVVGERCPYDLSPYVMHRSKRHWRDPEHFDPDRWLATAELPPPAAYVPFGFGPRSCVGAAVGQAQLILFCQLATCEFEFEPAPGRRPKMTLGGFAIPADLVGSVRPSWPRSDRVVRG